MAVGPRKKVNSAKKRRLAMAMLTYVHGLSGCSNWAIVALSLLSAKSAATSKSKTFTRCSLARSPAPRFWPLRSCTVPGGVGKARCDATSTARTEVSRRSVKIQAGTYDAPSSLLGAFAMQKPDAHARCQVDNKPRSAKALRVAFGCTVVARVLRWAIGYVERGCPIPIHHAAAVEGVPGQQPAS
jgi:hypothetical protein